METFKGAREFVENPSFHEQRKKSLKTLDFSKIDLPVVDIVEDTRAFIKKYDIYFYK